MGIYEDRQIHPKTCFRPIKLQESRSGPHTNRAPIIIGFLLTGLRIYTGEYKAQGPTLCPTEGRALRGPRALYLLFTNWVQGPYQEIQAQGFSYSPSLRGLFGKPRACISWYGTSTQLVNSLLHDPF